MNISKKTKYFINKSQNQLRTAKKTAYRIQQYNNYLIDNYIESVDNGNPKKPTQSMLWAEVSVLMKPAVYSNYQKIINSKYTSDTAFFKSLIRDKAQKDLNRAVENQVNRIAKNVDYVEKTLKNFEMPVKEYHKMLDEQKNRSVANRRQVMEDVAKARGDILASEGLNIPSDYSYRDLNVLSEQLLRESQSASEWEEVQAMNDEAESNGKDKVYSQKKWVWTGAGKTTRHMEMESYPVIDIDDTFQVVDENTDTLDEMLYPRDTQGSFENVAGCVCEIEYLDLNLFIILFVVI